MAAAAGQGDHDGLAAVQQRLDKLDAAAEALAQELKVAYQDLRVAQSVEERATCQQRYDDLKAEKKDLDQRRAALEAQLAGQAQTSASGGVIAKLESLTDNVNNLTDNVNRLNNNLTDNVNRLTNDVDHLVKTLNKEPEDPWAFIHAYTRDEYRKAYPALVPVTKKDL